MRKCIILILLCLSCNLKNEKEEPCVKKMEYFALLNMLIPESAIVVHVEDKDEFLQKKLSFKKLKEVILYSIKEEDRRYFRVAIPESILDKVEHNTIIFTISTNYFRPDILIDDVRRENKWTPEQIQKAIEGDIGFVFEKDTIRVKMCGK
ncbi:hypothetical protein KHA90_04910 [Flavobacterium psychroterrae]|uniref:Uncharacterized protein n=1 Tax=Flavobacterium psychroterrae TaxID=2133767 RepID=A0ABS5P884_9FLAO|nr:hypothetical protein [Flavobacterium psychroterrae]MBS7230356.1 hypothetical protein [Flavobacterium psychroterrae]